MIQRLPLMGLSLMLLTLIFDQATKYMILEFFTAQPDPITLTPFFKLVLAFNRGVSFSLLSQETVMGVAFLICLTLIITGGLFFWLLKCETTPLAFGLGLMIGGALGNIIDRFRFGGVIDFLYFHWQEYSFPAFNIADCGITLGVGCLLLDQILEWRALKASQKVKK